MMRDSGDLPQSPDARSEHADGSPEDFMVKYREYLDGQATARAERARTMLAGLTPREATLVREAIVLGHVAGVQAVGQLSPYPKDSAVVEHVLNLAAMSFSDIYPTLAHLAGEGPLAEDEDADDE